MKPNKPRESFSSPGRRTEGSAGQAVVAAAFKSFEDIEENPVDMEVIDDWLSKQPEDDYAQEISATMSEIWRSGPPSRDVKCIMRFYNDPNTRLEERQEVATYRRGAFEIVYMIKGINQVTQGPRFGYETNQDAQEDLPKALNPVTNDVPAVAAFNRVFPMGETNCAVALELIPDLLRAIWARRPTIIIPFGQSGSGKTYTLEGDEDVPGLIPRLIDSTIVMIEAVRPANFIIMAQFAQVYKDKRIDLLVEDGDVILGKLKPWPIMIICKRSRKLGYTSRSGDVYEGFITDDDMQCYDSDGKMIGKVVKEYKKTLLELVCQTLKEKHTPQELRQYQYDESRPDELFQRLAMRMIGVQKDMLLSISDWYRTPPNNQVVRTAQKKALLTVTNLIDYLKAKAFVSKSDFSNQVQHVPVDGFCLKRINSTREFITMWRAASERRVTAATSNNETSSRATLTGKLSIVWSHPMYANQPLPNALSTITFDDLPGAESAGDFTTADPLYKIRTLETNDIGSDLLKLGLLLGRQTAPSGRKVSEDIRSIDDKQAVTAIILTGKTNHSDVAQTLRFAHHAGTTIVQEIHLQEAAMFLDCVGSNQPADIIAVAKEIWDELVPDRTADLLLRLKKSLGTTPVSAKKVACGQIFHILSGVISLTICRMNPEDDNEDAAQKAIKKYQAGAPPPARGTAAPQNNYAAPTRAAANKGVRASGAGPAAARRGSMTPSPSPSPQPHNQAPQAHQQSSPRSASSVKQLVSGFEAAANKPRPTSPRKPGNPPKPKAQRDMAQKIAKADSDLGAEGFAHLRDTNVDERSVDAQAAKKTFETKRLTFTLQEDEKHSDELRVRLESLYERVIRRVSRVEKMLHKKFDALMQSLDLIVAQSSDEFSGMEGDILEMESGLGELEGDISFTRADLEAIRETATSFSAIRNRTASVLEIIESMSIPIHRRVSACHMHDCSPNGRASSGSPLSKASPKQKRGSQSPSEDSSRKP